MTAHHEAGSLRRPLFDLAGLTAVVVGGSSGIGLAAGRWLARAGARTVLASRSADKLEAAVNSIREEGGDANSLTCDLRNSAEIIALAEQVAARYRGADILVNSAGVLVPNRAALETPIDEWQEAFDVNTTGVFLCCQAFGRQMTARKWGRIINVSSQASVVSLPRQVAYTASQGALDAMTRSLAIEFASDGVTVNGIAPTFVVTPMTAGMLKDEELLRAIRARIPIGRLATPDDIGAAIAYLASREAGMVTGHLLMVDGGWTAGQPGLGL
jgi:NAD(P)-dependent dehydrogenase (short-subunit alcohol dehydrogenase family)